MALFTTTKKKETKPKKAVTKRAAVAVPDERGALSGVLKAPWLSEKALIGTERGVYVFDVAITATKGDIARAVEKFYKVVPLKVRVANVRAEKVRMRSRRGFGTTAARRKAYVYLKKGETIQLA